MYNPRIKLPNPLQQQGGVGFTVNISMQIPFKQIITQKNEKGEYAISTEALIKIVDEAIEELRRRGVKY